MTLTSPSTPAPKPAPTAPPPPSPGPKLSLFGFDDDESRFFQPTETEFDTRQRALQKDLTELRPQFCDLVREREMLRAKCLDDTAVTGQLSDAWEGSLFRSIHQGSWSEFFPFIESLSVAPDPAFLENNAFFLGARFGNLAKSVTQVMELPLALMQAIVGHTVYPPAKPLVDAFIAAPNAANQKALVDYLGDYRDDAFAGAFDPAIKSWSMAEIKKLVARSPQQLRDFIQRKLMRLPVSTLVFTPTITDPFAGWNQFWRFVRYYSKLPSVPFATTFMPFILSIRPMPPMPPPAMPAPSAAPATTTVATP